MATETPPKRPAGKRAPVTDVRPPSPLTAYLPWAALALVAALLALLISKGAWYSVHAAAVLGTSVIVGLGIAGWYHVHTLQPTDRLRLGVTAVTVLAVAAALVPWFYSVYPPAPQATARLSQAGDRAVVNLAGAASSVVVETSGDFKPDLGPTAHGNYRLVVRHDGRDEDVEGTFSRTADEEPARPGSMSGGPTNTDPDARVRGGHGVLETKANRHTLATLRGAGRYEVTLDAINDTLRPPLVVAVGTDPFNVWILGGIFGLLAAAVLAVDTLLSRRGMESAYAAAMLVPLAAVFYLHAHVTRATLAADLLAAGIVGALAGGLGGEVLARLVRAVAPKG